MKPDLFPWEGWPLSIFAPVSPCLWVGALEGLSHCCENSRLLRTTEADGAAAGTPLTGVSLCLDLEPHTQPWLGALPCPTGRGLPPPAPQQKVGAALTRASCHLGKALSRCRECHPLEEHVREESADGSKTNFHKTQSPFCSSALSHP